MHATAGQGQLTVRWLINQHGLALREIVPTPHRFTVVHISELADPSRFLLPDSIVLTLGMAFEHKPEAFDEYVATLAAADVVAIGFGTGLSFATVPPALIDAATAHHVGLFEVPHDTPFISIQSTVNTEISRQHMRQQERLNAAQRRAHRAAIAGGIPELLECVADEVHAALCIQDNDQRVIAHVTHGKYDASVPDPAGHVTRHKMLTFGERYHRLIAVSRSPLRPEHRILIQHCGSLADLLLQRPSSLRNARSELNSMALSMLLGLAGEAAQMEPVFARIADSRGEVRPVVIHADTADHLAKALAALEHSLWAGTRERCTINLDSCTALLLVRGSRSVESVIKLFGELARQIRICVGGARPWQNIDHPLVGSLVTSAKSIPVGSYVGPQDNALAWLRGAAVMEALDQRAHETIGRLEHYDELYGAHLRLTLATHLQRGAQIKATAEALGIHRHTVRSRLAKISEICEVNLDDPVTRAELLIVTVTRKPRPD